MLDLNRRAEQRQREREREEAEQAGRDPYAVYPEKTAASTSNADPRIIRAARELPFAGEGPDPLGDD